MCVLVQVFPTVSLVLATAVGCTVDSLLRSIHKHMDMGVQNLLGDSLLTFSFLNKIHNFTCDICLLCLLKLITSLKEKK